jgi:heme oxygenase
MTSEVLSRLRAATQQAHHRLEDRLQAIEQLATPLGRMALAPRYYVLHAGAEQAIAPHLDTLAGLDFAVRRRSPQIASDLATLGQGRPTLGRPPVVDSAAAALGWMYVLEGSTLGGRMIHRELERRGVGLEGLGFLDPYGEDTGARWRAFLAVMEREARDEAAIVDVVAGGVAGFAHAEACLCPEPVAA